ncbi:hypothetical protein A0H81_07616 [Grifola frondosa]|uniref:Uncharacterized protein n=1 Tax=Grifola frondosa TaxID=5627 RepID=A0A1C7M5C9_GRIFR|nr:hypothetical protein A0H81_07616 [Grifola frondosa]
MYGQEGGTARRKARTWKGRAGKAVLIESLYTDRSAYPSSQSATQRLASAAITATLSPYNYFVSARVPESLLYFALLCRPISGLCESTRRGPPLACVVASAQQDISAYCQTVNVKRATL